jgi:hypothetical protein
MCKQRVTVSVDEIGRPKPTHVSGKTFHDSKSVIERRLYAPSPQFSKAFEQDAERDFRVGITDRPEAVSRAGLVEFDTVKSALWANTCNRPPSSRANG